MSMTLEFRRAKWSMDSDGAWLSIQVPDPKTATAWLDQMEVGQTYTAKLARKVKKRSLDANAYYWRLVGELSKALNLPPAVIYRQHITEIGNYETICMRKDAYESFARIWCNGHLGRTTMTRESKLEGCVTVLAYYGSSDFDTARMSHLIDNCIQDCKELGIETKSPEEVASLLAQWDDKTDQSPPDQPGS